MEWTVAIGVDTHKRTHTAVALDRVGARVASCEVEATSAGYARLLAWASELGESAFALEGTGSYGAGLASLLLAVGMPVCEVERPRRRTSPAEASSGPSRRHRLNRGGDRQLNAALHVIARTRLRCHPETRAYRDRLLARGKSKREAMRCVKRQLARHCYRLLLANPALASP
jgi:transposase